ncbi:MAG: hypothetical protein JNL17_07640 [Cyclobacteriaceae bacterium]|nr:hypothetical protein [Cyclobacteriaceae bacterium]
MGSEESPVSSSVLREGDPSRLFGGQASSLRGTQDKVSKREGGRNPTIRHGEEPKVTKPSLPFIVTVGIGVASGSRDCFVLVSHSSRLGPRHDEECETTTHAAGMRRAWCPRASRGYGANSDPGAAR